MLILELEFHPPKHILYWLPALKFSMIKNFFCDFRALYYWQTTHVTTKNLYDYLHMYSSTISCFSYDGHVCTFHKWVSEKCKTKLLAFEQAFFECETRLSVTFFSPAEKLTSFVAWRSHPHLHTGLYCWNWVSGFCNKKVVVYVQTKYIIDCAYLD